MGKLNQRSHFWHIGPICEVRVSNIRWDPARSDNVVHCPYIILVSFIKIQPNTLITFHASYYLKVKVKVKFALQQAIKAQRGSRGISLPFL